MKIEQLEKDIIEIKRVHKEELDEVKRKQSLSTGNQIKTEKDLVAMNTKLDYIIKAIDEIKTERTNNKSGD